MHLHRIILHDFKNVADAELEFSSGVNCVVGNNGTGKTNLLDAIYYLSMTKSYFSQSDQYVIRHGCEEAIATGFYRMDNDCEEKISAAIRKGDKVIRRGEKNYSRFSEHIGLIPIVMVSPYDASLINDSGDERRRYLNFILSQIDGKYLAHIQQYNQLLVRRNKLLRDGLSGGDMLLDTISEQMAPHAQYIFEARKSLCRELLPIIQKLYSRISGVAEMISMEYRSALEDSDFIELMQANTEKDRALGYTLAGVQRDDIALSLDGHPLRKCGSQGQQKTFLLALKLAQLKYMQEAWHLTPILLLDDVFDKLDASRVEALLSIVSEGEFGQIFISDSNKVRVEALLGRLSADSRLFVAEKGYYSRQ